MITAANAIATTTAMFSTTVIIPRRLLALRTVLLAMMMTCILSACNRPGDPEQSWEMAAKGVYSGALSADGKHSIIGSIHHGGSLWATSRGERLFNWNHQSGQQSNIIASGFSPEGNFALTADHQTMVLWDTQNGEAITFWTAPNEVMSAALTRNGSLALLGLEDYSAVLFDVKRGGIKRTFYHNDRVRSVALSADDRLAITGSEDNTARLWDLEKGQQLFSWRHEGEVVTVAISPQGNLALTVAKYDRAVLWDTQTGEERGELPLHKAALKRGQSFTSAVFSTNGKLLLTGNANRLVQLWDTTTLTEQASWELPKRDAWRPTSVAVVALSFADRDNVFYAIGSAGFSHRLVRQ